jgi:hypothetical protein
VAGWGEDQVLAYLETRALPEAVKWVQESKKVADQFGLRLVAYEGGQHMTAIAGAENNEALTRLLHAANASPRMATLYRRYLDAWKRAGGDLFCHFNSVEPWSKWGSWGMLQYQDEDPAKSPKFLEAMRWASSQGQRVNVPRK